MTYRELYENALRTVCEDEQTTDTSDYEERAAYILATFCAQCCVPDQKYRAAHTLGEQSFTPVACVDLDHDFPLCDAFVPAAIYYLSAILVLDENEAMSEKFFSLYSDALAALVSSLPSSTESATLESITDRYGLM